MSLFAFFFLCLYFLPSMELMPKGWRVLRRCIKKCFRVSRSWFEIIKKFFFFKKQTFVNAVYLVSSSTVYHGYNRQMTQATFVNNFSQSECREFDFVCLA